MLAGKSKKGGETNSDEKKPKKNIRVPQGTLEGKNSNIILYNKINYYFLKK